jgi:GTPase SAR1 family protein
MTHSIGEVRSNPFATRFVRPGAVPFLFPPGLDAAALVTRLCYFGWRGAIIGPHGSGKSTLLESLCRELERAGRVVIRFTLHDGQRGLSAPRVDARRWTSDTIVAIDGYEQLSRWNRWRLARRCRRSRCGLLVTSHRPTSLPELLRTEVGCDLLERIVAGLLEGKDRLICCDDVRQAFSRYRDNVREALFALYDLQETRAQEELARL